MKSYFNLVGGVQEIDITVLFTESPNGVAPKAAVALDMTMSMTASSRALCFGIAGAAASALWGCTAFIV